MKGEVFTTGTNGETCRLPDARIVLNGLVTRESLVGRTGHSLSMFLPPGIFDIGANVSGGISNVIPGR